MSLKKMRVTMAMALVLALTGVGSVSAQSSPEYGGSGGAGFEDRCGGTKSTWGFLMRTGTLVDMIQMGCQQIGPSNPLADWAPFHGNGGGGGSAAAICGVNTYTRGISVYWGSLINAFGVLCYAPGAGTTGTSVPTYEFPTRVPGGHTGNYSSYACPSRQAVTGIKGRSGSVLDRISVFCSGR